MLSPKVIRRPSSIADQLSTLDALKTTTFEIRCESSQSACHDAVQVRHPFAMIGAILLSTSTGRHLVRKVDQRPSLV